VSSSFILTLFALSVVGAIIFAVYGFFTDGGSAEVSERTGYRYNFNEHQNYWNEDK
jgi:hypothetical protein